MSKPSKFILSKTEVLMQKLLDEQIKTNALLLDIKNILSKKPVTNDGEQSEIVFPITDTQVQIEASKTK